MDALPVGILVWVIGISLGGTTGYAINPARDFGPRTIYQLLPRKNKYKRYFFLINIFYRIYIFSV